MEKEVKITPPFQLFQTVYWVRGNRGTILENGEVSEMKQYDVKQGYIENNPHSCKHLIIKTKDSENTSTYILDNDGTWSKKEGYQLFDNRKRGLEYLLETQIKRREDNENENFLIEHRIAEIEQELYQL